MSENSFIDFSDSIRVQSLSKEYFNEACSVFSDIWLNYNILYSSCNISKNEFEVYVKDILFKRCLYDNKTSAIALDMTKTPPKLVSIVFAKDFYNDPVKESFKLLSESMQIPLTFNNEIMEHFTDNPLFDNYRKPGKITYFLHGGTRDEYAGQYVNGLSISTRTMMFLFEKYIKNGYIGYIGVGTHPEIIRRYNIDIQKQTNLILLTTKPIDTWKYKGKQVFKNAKGTEPAALIFGLFPNPLSKL